MLGNVKKADEANKKSGGGGVSETAAAAANEERASEQSADGSAECSADSSGEEVKKLSAAVEEEKDRYLRLNAEFQNYKKRVEKEKGDLIKYGNEKLLTDLLPVLDNIDRAAASSEGTQDTRLREGILLIRKAFDDVLGNNGVERIEAIGKAFDHDEHYAVMTEEAEGKEEGIVVDELQTGYKLNGKVIRPSMVKVSK